MSAQITTTAVASAADEAHVKRIWKAFWILAVLTVIELVLGLTIFYLEKGDPSYMLILFIKGVITILTFAKAFYIISIFMHLGDEVRGMIMSIAVPALLFIWFITALLAEGNSFKNMRNTNANSRPYVEQKVRHHLPVTTVPAENSDKKLD
ncbi:MAG: cytochrome C oxidase subunit IV family protein [Ginsengibacter sp.]|jgi:cytochrome c oxidase subunit IV